MIRGQEGLPLPSGSINKPMESLSESLQIGEPMLGLENPFQQPQSPPVSSLPSEQTIFATHSQSESNQSRIPVSRDFERWVETDGFPPISGGSGESREGDKGRYLTVEEAAELLGVTPGRIHGMVADGQLPSEKRKVRVEREMEKLFIPIQALEAYRNDPKRKHAPKHHRGNPKEGN